MQTADKTVKSNGTVRVEVLENGAVWRLVIDAPKANVLDAAKVAMLTTAYERAAQEEHLKAVVIEGEGKHFSFGASVEEHLPPEHVSMLKGFHALFRAMLRASVPTFAVVRGQCLGGGLELASFCTRVWAAPDAVLGQPEIRLGVIAPIASAFLAERVGRAHMEDLVLSGRSVNANEALAMGLVDQIADDPRAAALAWVKEHLLPHSASSLRFACRAARLGLAERFERDLARLEHLYFDELMATHDAREGLAAFLEKRAPRWENR